MTKIEASLIIIGRPIEEVWPFVTDLSKHLEWCAEGEKMQQASPGPLSAGSPFLAVTPNGNNTGRVDEYDPNRKVTFQQMSGPEKGSTLSYTFEPIEGGKTRLREIVEFRPSRLSRLLMPFVAGSINPQGPSRRRGWIQQRETHTRVSSVSRIRLRQWVPTER
jgi:uncharacterized protein YndB with AHSA1/START domain